jgi:hypothetical protein
MKANGIHAVPATIGNLTDAIVYWRSKRGGSISGNEKLYTEMKAHSSFRECFGPSGSVTQLIKTKVQEALRTGQATISSPPESYRGLACQTLGSYRLDIAYNHSVSPGLNRVELTLSGSDRWDFDTSPNQSVFRNLFHEWIPSLFAGKGTPFGITYRFTITLDIST